MNRLFGCAIGIEVETEHGLHMHHPQIAKEVHLWRDPKQPEQTAIWNSHIVLNHNFFEEIINNPIPIDMRAISTLKRSPIALDIYMWLTCRISYLSRRTRSPKNNSNSNSRWNLDTVLMVKAKTIFRKH